MTAIFLAITGVGSSVSVSGETINSSSVTTATSAVRFNSDGTVDQGVNGVFTQIDAATDWVIPNGAAPSNFEIRLTVSSGTAPNTGGSSAVNTWLALTTNRLWELQRGSIGTLQGTWLIEIRRGSGPVIASGSYVMDATVDPP